MKRVFSGLLSAAAFTTIALSGAVHAKENRPNIPEDKMLSHCKGEAAKAFNVQPGEVLTLPVERQNGEYMVYGQTPAEGQNALFFTCSYNKHKEFDWVKMTSDKRSASGTQSERISREEMPRYCSGMASGEFKVNPRYVSTDEAVRESDGTFTVKGQYEYSSTENRRFICKFDEKRHFTKVYPSKR
jgi:hypothetical protein